MKICNYKPLTAALLLAASFGAMSAPTDGTYLGLSVGAPHFQDSVNGVSGSGSGVSGKLFAGYQVNPNFALEAGVADLGHVSNSTGRVNSHGEYLDAVGIAPLNDKWSLLGSVGLAHVNLNTTSGDASGNGLKLGLGAQYAFSSKVALRGEMERYRPDAFGAKTSIDQYTVGVKVAF